MPKEKKYLLSLVSFALVSTAFFAVFFLKSPVSGQQSLLVEKNEKILTAPPASEKGETVENFENGEESEKLTERERYVSPPVVKKTSLSLPSSFNAGAATVQNRSLKFNLTWAFGGKSQRGWYLYESLIQKMIGVETGADSPEFASAVAFWQQSQGLMPTGIIDNATFKIMTETWQTQRLGRRVGYADENGLYDAPISDFWDSERDSSRLKVEGETYAAYKRMIAAAAKDLSLRLKATPAGELAPDEKFLKIISAFRSREHQEALRRQSPGSGSAGLAVNSPHFTGHALDIYVGGEPVTTKDFNRALQIQTPVYKWLVKNAEKFGFYPYFYEPWHWEYIPERLRRRAQTPPNIPTDSLEFPKK